MADVHAGLQEDTNQYSPGTIGHKSLGGLLVQAVVRDQHIFFQMIIL